MVQTIISVSCLIVGVGIGYWLSLCNKDSISHEVYEDIKQFAHSYSDLSVQLMNANKSFTVPNYPKPDEIKMSKKSDPNNYDVEDLDFALLGGALESSMLETN